MIKLSSLVLSLLILAGCASKISAPVEDRSQMMGGASAQSGAGYHTVKAGETLYGIALEHGQDYKDLATWNNITDPRQLRIGQVLRVQPQAGVESSAAVAPISTGGGVEQRALDAAPVASSSSALKREPRVNKEAYSDGAYARLQNPGQTVEIKPEPVKAATAVGAGENEVEGVVWSWPVTGKIVAGFAQNKGVDIAGKAGTPVLAAADGRVVYSGSALKVYGNMLVVKHEPSPFLSVYAHNQKLIVKEGDMVKRGQKIAEMGDTGTDAVKLHFEIRKQGNAVNPIEFLPKQ